ncbi:MAG: glutaredoxin family protein [Deltaproteobacteria bacterium]|nr:MAG: glutaredoxin family protein [Deltaproteobacteria bacterium]
MTDGRALLPREAIVCTGGAAECQPARMVQLTLYTRAQCPLCHEMRAVIERVARDVPLALELIDVDTDAALAAAYGDEVPVLAINGRRAFAVRVDAGALRARLARERA